MVGPCDRVALAVGAVAMTPETYERKIEELEKRVAELSGRGKRPDNFYEVLPEIVSDDGGQSKLYACFTPNNGIRVGISTVLFDEQGNVEDENGWHEFDFTDDQAEAIGQALVRWAQRRRAESEMVRVWGRP